MADRQPFIEWIQGSETLIRGRSKYDTSANLHSHGWRLGPPYLQAHGHELPRTPRCEMALKEAEFGVGEAILEHTRKQPPWHHHEIGPDASVHVEFNEFTGYGKDYPLADIGDPVGCPLEVVGGPEQVIRAVDQRRVLQYHCDQVTVDPIV